MLVQNRWRTVIGEALHNQRLRDAKFNLQKEKHI